jgi:hypothetical protein
VHSSKLDIHRLLNPQWHSSGTCLQADWSLADLSMDSQPRGPSNETEVWKLTTCEQTWGPCGWPDASGTGSIPAKSSEIEPTLSTTKWHNTSPIQRPKRASAAPPPPPPLLPTHTRGQIRKIMYLEDKNLVRLFPHLSSPCQWKSMILKVYVLCFYLN